MVINSSINTFYFFLALTVGRQLYSDYLANIVTLFDFDYLHFMRSGIERSGVLYCNDEMITPHSQQV